MFILYLQKSFKPNGRIIIYTDSVYLDKSFKNYFDGKIVSKKGNTYY